MAGTESCQATVVVGVAGGAPGAVAVACAAPGTLTVAVGWSGTPSIALVLHAHIDQLQLTENVGKCVVCARGRNLGLVLTLAICRAILIVTPGGDCARCEHE